MAFFTLSISINSVQNVQSSALDDSGFDKLGFFQLAIVYLMLGSGSLFATPVMSRLGGPRLCMVLGAVFDCFWILASILPALRQMYQNGDDNDGYAYAD